MNSITYHPQFRTPGQLVNIPSPQGTDEFSAFAPLSLPHCGFRSALQMGDGVAQGFVASIGATNHRLQGSAQQLFILPGVSWRRGMTRNFADMPMN